MMSVVLPLQIGLSQAANQVVQLTQSLRASAEASGQATVWQLDAQTLQDFDSSALSVLLKLGREAEQAGAQLVLSNMPEPLRNLARLYGVDSILGANQVNP